MNTPRIFVSMPADQWLTPAENETKWSIVAAIENLGYIAEIFTDPRGKRSQAGALAWSAQACDQVMRRCEGCVILGFPRWRAVGAQKGDDLSTEFNQYEGAVAYTLGLPLLVLVQAGVRRRVIFDPSYNGYVGIIPEHPTPKWLKTNDFRVPFGYWRRELERRRDIFLGYCGSSSRLAREIKRFLMKELNVTVLDWKADFDPAHSILQQIEEASRRCGAGIFLFTKDDKLSSEGSVDRAVPRDNVVFEAGYFSSLKSKARVLVVREVGTKLPADLGGDIYASIKNKKNIGPIKPVLRRFLRAL